MKQKYVDLAKRIVDEKTVFSERAVLEDELVEMAYKIATELEVSPEDFDKVMSDKRDKNGGFSMGYLYSEKVLPIGDKSESHKINRDDKRDIKDGVYKEIEKADEYGIKKIPEKLVRDNIPGITEATAMNNLEYIRINKPKLLTPNNPLNNYRAKVRIANGLELKTWLVNKLEEESKEFLAAVEKNDVIEDLGDVLEIVETFTARY